MAPSEHRSSQAALPGAFVAITFSTGTDSHTSYGEVAQVQDDTLHIKCLSPDDFKEVTTGKTLHLRFPFDGSSSLVNAALVERTDSGVVIKLHDEDSNISRRILLRGGSVLPIQVFLSAGRVIEGRTVNVGAGGAMVVLSTLPRPNTEVLFRLVLPDKPGTALQGQAKIAWARKVAGENQVGLSFISLETPEVRRLCRLAFRAASQAAVQD